MSDSTALAVVKKHEQEGALIYVSEDDLHPQPLFKLVLTKIPAVRSDFHDKKINGEMMPKAHHVQRIARYAGISFETINTVKNETSWTVIVRGFRKASDGSMDHADGSYDYDWVDRAKDGPKKFALQRAETGAQLRAIRKVLGLPITFNEENFLRAIVVGRIVTDTGAMLADPALRDAVVSHAIHAEAQIFGPTEPKQLEVGQVEEVDEPEVLDIDFGSDPVEEPETQSKDDAIRDAKVRLEQYQNNEAVLSCVVPGGTRHPIQAIKETLADDNATLEEINELIEKLQKIPGVV